MERLKCTIRAMRDEDLSMLTLLAEETLHPLAVGAGHPERYHADQLLALLDRADVLVADSEAGVAGFAALEQEGDALALRCVCVNPAMEARGVAHQLVDWAEGLAIDRRLARLTAFVPAGDAPSLHLYRGHEFAELREAGATPGMVRLEKRLPQTEG